MSRKVSVLTCSKSHAHQCFATGDGTLGALVIIVTIVEIVLNSHGTARFPTETSALQKNFFMGQGDTRLYAYILQPRTSQGNSCASQMHKNIHLHTSKPDFKHYPDLHS